MKKGHITGLDGLRALAVLAVILYHVFPAIFPGGYIGVDVFFVISGFLITTLLLKEYRKTGKIDFVNFWRRRARRLVPAIVVLIGVVSSVALFIHGDILVGLGRQVIGALTFSNNWIEIVAGSNYFDSNNLQLFTHFWSLAVEEQFYAVWPLVLLGLVSLSSMKRYKSIGLWVCLLLAAGSAGLMAVLYNGQNPTRVYYGTDTHLFGLMIGAVLAFWEYSRTIAVPTRRLDDYAPFEWRLFGKILPVQVLGWAALVGLLVLIATMSEHSALPYRGGLVIVCLLTALVIMAVASAQGVLRRLFTLRALEWIGARSYGMYLWHWPVYVMLHATMPAVSWMVAASTFVLTVLIAAISYKYIEMPVRSGGLRQTIMHSLNRRAIIISNAETIWRTRPHPLAFVCLVVVVLTGAAIITAPGQTKAQVQVKAGETAIRDAATKIHPEPLKLNTKTTPRQQSPPVNPPVASPTPPAAITGADITLIGDSVSLASAPSLVERFPGILIDAEISRSLRVGGLEDVAAVAAAGNLRRVVVVALGTNGYYGTGKLDELMGQLAGHDIVLVTAFGDREWILPNNQNLHETAAKYTNTYIADWSAAISARPDALGPDGIHPNSAGGPIYTDCITTAIAQIQQQ